MRWKTLIRETQTSFARENRLSSDFQDRLLKARLVPLQSLVPRVSIAPPAPRRCARAKRSSSSSRAPIPKLIAKSSRRWRGRCCTWCATRSTTASSGPMSARPAASRARARSSSARRMRATRSSSPCATTARGIDPEKDPRDGRRARAGLTPIRQLSEQEAINLIFRPGCSHGRERHRGERARRWPGCRARRRDAAARLRRGGIHGWPGHAPSR